MRTLFAVFFATFIGTVNLAGQVIHPPIRGRRPAPETGIYLVTFRPGVSLPQRAAAVQASGARPQRIYNAVNAASVEIPDVAALARLRNDPRVLSVFMNRPITLLAAQRGSGNGGGAAKPKPPSNLGATAISSSQINLSWADNSDNETGFAIERCAGAGCANFTEINRVNLNVNTFVDPGLTAQTTYRYRVLAFNAAGNSKYSNTAEATTPASTPQVPTAPSNLLSSVVSYSQINLNWSDGSNNEDGFRLERCTGALASCGDVNFVQIAQLGPNVTSFNNVGLQAQTTYTYRARAFNAAGTSGYSNYVEATTPAAPPAAPSNLTSSVIAYNQVNLSWSDNSANESGFQLERCAGAMTSCANFAQIAQVGPNVASFSDLGVQPQATYTYRIRTFNAGGNIRLFQFCRSDHSGRSADAAFCTE